MKLHNLNADDYFQNKSHNSIKNEITHLKNKRVAFVKERIDCDYKIAYLYNKYEETYRNRVGNIKEFENSTEYAQYNLIKLKFQDKNLKYCSSINNIDKQILHLSNKQLFDEQKEWFNKSGLPAQFNNPTRIISGPQSTTANPYYAKDNVLKFVGLPWDYPWWMPKTTKQYAKLSTYLKANNMQGFTKVFAGKTATSTKFIMIADHGNFIWRTNISNYAGYDSMAHSSVRRNGVQYSTKQFIKALVP